MTLHTDYVKMTYGSHIKIKILAGLLLGDFKNFLIRPSNIIHKIGPCRIGLQCNGVNVVWTKCMIVLREYDSFLSGYSFVLTTFLSPPLGERVMHKE